MRNEKAAGKLIYPAGGDIFAAFKLTPFDKVKVVIWARIPYHGPNQAHGLSFSKSAMASALPPSLQTSIKK